MYSQIFTVMIAALFVSGVVLAQSAQSPASSAGTPLTMRHASIPSAGSFYERFNAADKNGDRALSRIEAKNSQLTIIARHFDEIDADGNGKVTLDELRAYLARHIQTGPMV